MVMKAHTCVILGGLTDAEAGAALQEQGESSCHEGLPGDVMLLPSPGDRMFRLTVTQGTEVKQAASPF